MKKYGFFGGAFNPPTIAHIEYAKRAVKEMELDKLFFVPVGDYYNKPELISEKHRYKMLQKICKNEEKLEVLDIELNRKENLTAIDAFHIIKQKYKHSDIYFVLGSDNFIKLPTWNKNKELINDYKYIVLERDGNKLDNIIKENKINCNIIYGNFQISSTMVRDAIKRGEKISKWTFPVVEEYIKENNLYKFTF